MKFFIVIIILIISINLFPINFKSETFYLPNGLRVILSPDIDSGNVCVFINHLTGVKDDEKESKGISYLFQFLMFLKTENLDSYESIFLVKKTGGKISGKVYYDNSQFYQVVPREWIRNSFWIERERIKNLRININDFITQKNKLFKRIYDRISFDPYFNAMDWIRERLFEGTPYNYPIYGSIKNIKNFTFYDLMKTYRRFSDFSKINLILTGSFDKIKVKKLINIYFGIFPLNNIRQVIINKTYNSPLKKLTKNWLVKGLNNNFTLYGFRMPPKTNIDYIYSVFLKYYLTDKKYSRLSEILNRINNLNIEIFSKVSDNIELNSMIIRISTKKRIYIEKAKYVFNKEIESLQKKLLSYSQLKLIKDMMELDFLKQISTPEGKAKLLAESYQIYGENKLEDYLKKIKKINSYGFIRFCRKYLNNKVILNVYKK